MFDFPKAGLKSFLLLAAIVFGAAVLRLWNLPQQGFIQWDEAGYALEARYWLDGARDWTRFVTGQADGAVPYYGKPAHVVLIALSVILFEESPFAAQFVSAAFGILTVPVVYLLGKLLDNHRVGWLAAFLLAFLPFHIIYSRLAFADADATFFFQLAFLFWMLAGRADAKRRMFLFFAAGLGFGMAVTTNYRCYPVVVISVLVLGLVEWARSKATPRIVSLLPPGALLVGLAVLPTGWQVLFSILRVYAEQNRVSMNANDYIGQLQSLLGGEQIRSYPRSLMDWLVGLDAAFYGKALVELGGVFWSLLLASAAIVFVWRVARSGLEPRHRVFSNTLRPISTDFAIYWALTFLFPLAFFTFYPFKASRFIVVVLPSACMFIAFAIERLIRSASPRLILQAMAAIVLGGFLIESLASARLIVEWQSNFESAMRYIQNHQAQRVLSTQPSIAGYYLPPTQARWTPDSEMGLYNDFQDGFRYLLLDEQGYVASPNQNLLKKIETELAPVFVAPDSAKIGPAYFLDQNPTQLSFDQLRALEQRLRRERGYPQVRVYELTEDFIAALPKPPTPPATVGTELLKNPGFEETAGGRPMAWSPYGKPIFDTAGKAHNGRAFVCTSSDGQNGYTQAVPIVPGKKYLLSQFVKSGAETDQTARLQINWLNSSGSIVGVSLELVPALAEWRQRWFVVQAPAESQVANVYISVHLNARVCFDDFSFAEVKQ
jgi:4-amino-4-deoxy-L-arabinose transferase-like glycosyltransferase